MGWLQDAFGRQQDAHGQPLNSAYRREAVAERQIDELIGIVKGVLADGMVHQGEVEFLLSWLNANRAAAGRGQQRPYIPGW